ncbi:hypothetical protein NG895_06375 [Aeoliella sp. ICT_H6.2]|uniref:Uncharacterized protein n=1 Tax=Aeoliella straminimaris TaxID=2954799 RepID=A0A9X2JGG4_9BACT|nr:hypothetical protein [Aeoliella straminimaris]MCO6043528.1 hypothetical protein [Aeoliella straminimaris]
MDRSPCSRRTLHKMAVALMLLSLIPSTGCHQLLATSIWVLQGGNVVPAVCDKLEGKRVVVVCRPPSSSEYSHAGASRILARNVTQLLRENVPKIDMVDSREVDKWMDESDWDNMEELGGAVKAEQLLVIDLEHFDLYKGKTLYQGAADLKITLYDVEDNNSILWEKDLGEVLFPQNSAIPIQDKAPKQFEREYIGILARRIAVYFYKHDPNADFALDALANR